MPVVVVGRGRWGSRLAAMLDREGHPVTCLSLRPRSGEDEACFIERAAEALHDAIPGAGLVWLAVPPFAPQAALVAGALRAGRHVVVEKPWWVDDVRTAGLLREARRRGLIAAVHFQYCHLEAWPGLTVEFNAADAAFAGVFTTARSDRVGVPAPDNLGSHLVAVRRHWFAEANLVDLRTGYGSRDLRQVTLRRGPAEQVVDFTANPEPIVQRFLRDVLCHAAEGAAFPLDLAFAAGVQGELAAFAAPGVPGPGVSR